VVGIPHGLLDSHSLLCGHLSATHDACQLACSCVRGTVGCPVPLHVVRVYGVADANSSLLDSRITRGGSESVLMVVS
jgi:hypothetical protein